LKRTADAIFLNGIVITVDSRDRVCEAVAVCGNRILAIGTSEEMKALAEADTQKILRSYGVGPYGVGPREVIEIQKDRFQK
jgi:hypothetical protein